MKLTPILLMSAALLSPPAYAADVALADCFQTRDFDREIAGCTQVLSRGALTGKLRSLALSNRGAAFVAKGDKDHALEDFAQAIQADPTNANAYENHGHVLFDKGDTAGALADLEAALRVQPRNRKLVALRDALRAQSRADTPGSKDEQNAPALAPPESLDALHDQAFEFYMASKYEDSLRATEIFEAQARRQLGPSSLRVAEAFRMKGLNQEALRRYREAAASYEAFLARTQNAAGRRKNIRNTTAHLALVYDSLGRYGESEKLFRKLLAVRDDAPEHDDKYSALALNGLAILEKNKGHYSEARQLVNRAIAISEKLEGPESGSVTSDLTTLANIYHDEQRPAEAEQLYRRVMAIEEKTGGKDSPELAKSLGNLAILYTDTGRYPEAEKAIRRAIAIFEKLYGTDDPTVAQGLSILVNVYQGVGRYHDKEVALNRALITYEKAFGPDSEEVADTLVKLGTLLTSEKRTAESRPILARSLAIAEKVYAPDDFHVAITLNNVANALAGEGRNAEAEKLWSRALAIYEKSERRDSAETTVTLNNLAMAAQDSGHFVEARAFLNRAFANIRLSPSFKPLASVDTIEGAARLAEATGDKTEAEKRFGEALAILEKTFGPAYPRSARMLAYLSQMANDRQDRDRAMELLRRATAIAIHAGSVQSADAAADLLAFVSKGLASTAWEAAAQAPGRKAALAQEAFVAAQRTQLGSAASAVAQMAARFGAGTAAGSEAVREQQDLNAQAQVLDRTLTGMLGSEKRDETALANLRSQIAAVDTKLKAADARIAHDFPQFAELASPNPLTLAQTQALLRPDEALVTWLFLDRGSFVFAVTQGGSDWKRIDLTEQQLAETVTKLRSGLDFAKVSRGLAAGKSGREVVFNLAASHDLYDKLIGPVQALVGLKKTIVAVPSGALTSLPLQVLVTQAPKRAATSLSDSAYRQAAWLAKSHAITVLPSVASLRALRTFARASQATRPLVGFANPVFSRGQDGKPARGVAARGAAVGAYTHFFRGGAVDIEALRTGLPALPDTADELQAVAKQLGAPADDLEIGEKASVATVKTLPLDTYHVVYFATHGLVAGEVNGLTEPALALTIPARPTDADSGLLTASDVAQLKLDADWVVLSACNTAAGDTPGAEGLSGLARAFFYAGARALLVSHWPVQSDAAVQLTTHAFAAMASDPKLGRSEALRLSMLALMAAGGDNAYPAVWAPFVVVGEDAR